MTENIKTENNMSSSGLTRRSRNKDFMCLVDARSGSGMTSARGETGRSMVEMLGTLAIIGVLSVGGIAGYTYAMNKYYANEILAGASERAVLVAAQLASGREPNLREFAHYPNVGGTFGNAEELEDGSGFVISVSGVKGAVCKNLIEATEGTDITIANDDDDLSGATCDDETLNNLVFVFKTGNGRGDNTSGCSTTQITCGTGCCPTDAECVDNQCVLGEVTCAVGEDMFCYDADGLTGECIDWRCCEQGRVNSGNLVIGTPGAGGICSWDPNYNVLYCAETMQDGRCRFYDVCPTGGAFGDIIGVPDAATACADDGQEQLYCVETNDDGQCVSFYLCETNVHSGNLIVGTPDAWGVCADEGYEIFCCEMDYSTGTQCKTYCACDEEHTEEDLIFGIPTALGACGTGTLYCNEKNSNNQCVMWDYCPGTVIPSTNNEPDMCVW